MRRHEVFKNVQTLTEITLYGKLYGMTGRVSHKSSHAGKLLYLLIRASCSGVCHHIDIVVFIKSVKKVVSELVICLLPGIDNLLISLGICDKTSLVVSGDPVNLILGPVKKLLLL